jgi:hypothetical protein
MMPTYITHYFVRGFEPFRSISDLDDASWQRLCGVLADRRAKDPTYHRRFGPRYRGVRLEAEEELRSRFKLIGGRVERTAPIYFCLGSSEWWRGFCDHDEIRIELSDVDPETISFTYPDSLTSMGMLARFGIHHEAKPYHGKVFGLEQIGEVVREFGIPTGVSPSGYREYHKEGLEIYIEAQLWSDKPIKSLKKRAANQTSEPTAPSGRGSP